VNLSVKMSVRREEKKCRAYREAEVSEDGGESMGGRRGQQRRERGCGVLQLE